MKWLLIFVLFVFGVLNAQSVLVLGENVSLTPTDTAVRFEFAPQLPDSLADFKAILIFSSANSTINLNQEIQLENYLLEGGSLYLGADNWPFVEESNQLTTRFYENRFYGNFDDSLTAEKNTVFDLDVGKAYYAGVTTVSFPMHFKLKVEAWANDNPIILSGYYGKGKILLDGGYSRFLRPKDSQELLDELLDFLLLD